MLPHLNTTPESKSRPAAAFARWGALGAAALLAACASPSKAPAPAPAPAAQPKPAPASTVATVQVPPPAPAMAPHLDPKSEISTGRSVYFDFDQFVIKNEFSALIERHARYLMSVPALAIRVEGNTDERGSTEYNLSLGQRRAEAVRKALEVAGVPASRVEAVSWGEERPRATGGDESAWAQNRRADLVYPPK